MLDLLKISKPVAVALVIGFLFALGGLGFWRGASRLHEIASNMAASARAERDSHWKAQLAESNRLAAEARTEAALRSAAAEAKAAEAQARAAEAETQLEHLNASLPNAGRTGLHRDRWRLLNPPQ